MGFLKFLRPGAERDRKNSGSGQGVGSSSSSISGLKGKQETLLPPAPLFHGNLDGRLNLQGRSSSSASIASVDQSDRASLGSRAESPAPNGSNRNERDKKQRLLGIGRRGDRGKDALKSIPYSTFMPTTGSVDLRHASTPALSEPLRTSSHFTRPTSPIKIHQRTTSIPTMPESATNQPVLGSLDFGSPIVAGQGGMRFSALFNEAAVALAPAQEERPPVPRKTLAPESALLPASRRVSTTGMLASDSVIPTTGSSKLTDGSDGETEKEDRERKSFWNIRHRRGSKAEVELEESASMPAEAKPTLREHSDKPKLRRPSSNVWQFARRTSAYNMPELGDGSALDINDSAIDDGSFQLKSFRHVSSASMALPGAIEPASSPALETSPLPVRPKLHSRVPSLAGSLGSVDDGPAPGKVSVAAFRKGIRAQSFVALDKDSTSSRPSVAGTAPPLGVGPDDDLPLSFLAGDGFKQKKKPSLPLASSAPTSPTTSISPPSSFARRNASPLQTDKSHEQAGLSIPRPQSVTKVNEHSKGFVVLGRTASRTDLTASPSSATPAVPSSIVSPGQGSQEMLMPSSEEMCTSPVDLEAPVSFARGGRQSPAPSLIVPVASAKSRPISLASPSGLSAAPLETTASSRPTSFFDDPLRLISSFIGRDDEPRIPTPPPRSDDGLDDELEVEVPNKNDSLGLDLAGLSLPLPPHAMPDDGLASPRSSLGRGPVPRPSLHARLASASGLAGITSPTAASPTTERPASLLAPAHIKPVATRSDSQDSTWRRPPVRPKGSVSSFQSASKGRGNAEAWADSSSDDDGPAKRKAPAATKPVPLPSRPSMNNFRAPSFSANTSTATAPLQVKPAFKPTNTRKATAESSSESDDASSSSSDEPLATIKQKASMSSLNVSSLPKPTPHMLAAVLRRPSSNANAPRPATYVHIPPTMPRHSASRSSMFNSSPTSLGPVLPLPHVLGSNEPKRSSQTFAPALRGQPSPASSVSGMTGDSSIGVAAPSTPKDSRRVSFLAEGGKAPLTSSASASVLGDAERDSRRNERRRDEAKNAVELGNIVNGPSSQIPDKSPGHELLAQPNYNPYLNPAGSFDPRLAWAMQQAATGPNYAMMHQQAMAYAKQQYQAAMAAAAMQAANDEWERSSAMTGFSGAPSMPSMPSMPSYNGFPTPSPYGMPQMFPTMTHHGGSTYGGSEYGSGRPSMHGGMHGAPGGGWGSQSVYGESFGPPPNLPPMPAMPRSSTAQDLRVDMPTPRKERSSVYHNDGATPRRRHFSSSSIDVGRLVPSRQPEEKRRPGPARPTQKAPLLQAHGGLPSAPSSWRREIDEREELDDRQKERARPKGAR